MELKDITNRPLRVRVLGTSQELKVKSKNYDTNMFYVYHKGKTTSYPFSFSEVAELTPIKHNDRYIAIGDQVKYLDRWHTVCGYHYHWGYEDWIVRVIESDFFEKEDFRFFEKEIEGHCLQEENEIQNSQKITASDKELITELERRGLVQEGKVIR